MTNEQAQKVLDKLKRELEKKDKQIERYIDILATNDMLHVLECEKKDQIIDLMAKEIESLHSSLTEEYGMWTTEYCQEGKETTTEGIKQYFKNKTKKG